MPFADKTRRKLTNLGSISKGSINPIVWDIPKVGLLGGILLSLTGSVAGTLSAPNAFGFSSIIKRVRLIANSGIDLFNVSGPGYHYLLRDHIEDYKDPGAGTNGRTAVTATTFDVSMYIPVTLNTRDALGLFMLQNEATLLQLSVEFEADASVATGATVTCTAIPFAVTYSVPVKPEDWPPLSVVHQIVEDSRAVSAAGEFSYRWPRGNTYCQVLHGLGIAASGADNWSRAVLRANQSDTLWDVTPAAANMEFWLSHGRARLLGQIPVDLLGTSGLGSFGSVRDVIYSPLVTELETVITASGAGTLYTIRRQLVSLKG